MPAALPGGSIDRSILNQTLRPAPLSLDGILSNPKLARLPTYPPTHLPTYPPTRLRPHLCQQQQCRKEEHHVGEPGRNDRVDDPAGTDRLGDLD
jgi:hypothetical protein